MPDIETTKIAIATLEGSESEAGQNVCDTFVAGGPVKGTWHLTCTFEDDVETGIQIRVGGIKLWFPFEVCVGAVDGHRQDAVVGGGADSDAGSDPRSICPPCSRARR